jgi:hypothetical protein
MNVSSPASTARAKASGTPSTLRPIALINPTTAMSMHCPISHHESVARM